MMKINECMGRAVARATRVGHRNVQTLEKEIKTETKARGLRHTTLPGLVPSAGAILMQHSYETNAANSRGLIDKLWWYG